MADSKRWFPKVKEAREELRAKAQEIIQFYMKNAADANVAGDFETAAKSLQWLIEHMPADDDGAKMIEPSVDRPVEKGRMAGPTIQIGFALGGIPATQQSLPPSVIEVDPIEPDPDTEH